MRLIWSWVRGPVVLVACIEGVSLMSKQKDGVVYETPREQRRGERELLTPELLTPKGAKAELEMKRYTHLSNEHRKSAASRIEGMVLR